MTNQQHPEPTAAALLTAATAPIAAATAGAIPGAILGIVTQTGDRAAALFGHAQTEPSHRPLHRETWFDLASLTKILFTTPAILQLAAQGRIALDDPLTAAIPDLRQYDPNAPERRLTLRQCLTHQTHLPAVEPLYTYGQDPATLRAFVLQRVWQAGPPVYSDINFILLGIAIERLTGRPLLDQPLPPGLSFHPDAGPPPPPPNAAPGAAGCYAARCTTRTPSPWAAPPATPACSARWTACWTPHTPC